MSNRQNTQDKPPHSPSKPWLTRPSGIQLSDWPPDIVPPEMLAMEAKWAKNGEKYNFKGPGPGPHHNRYVKETRNGPVFQKSFEIHRSADDYVPPAPKRGRAKAVDKLPVLEADEMTAVLPNPTRKKEREPKQAAAPLQQKVLQKTTGERSSKRLQRRAQDALELSERNQAQNSARQMMPLPAAPLIQRESAIRSTLQNPRTNPDAAQMTPSNALAKPDISSNARTVSADIEIAVTKAVAGSKAEPINADKPAVSKKGIAPSTKAVAATKTATTAKPTAAGKIAAKTITASTKSAVDKKAVLAPKIENSSERTTTKTMPKTSSPSKASSSAVTSNRSKTATQAVTSKKRKAGNTTTAAPTKRPRIGRACDVCRDKKTRCDGDTPCEACVKRKSNCAYGDGQSQLNHSAQDPDNRPPDDEGRSEERHQDKGQSSGSKSGTTMLSASSVSNGTKQKKRKREDETGDLVAQSHFMKKMKTVKTILQVPAAQAQLRAQQQLDNDIKRFMQEHSPISGRASPKRKRLPSEDEAECRPAKLQRQTPYAFEVLQNTKLETMQKVIIESLAQFASDFKPLQKIGHLVKCGKLNPQSIDIDSQEEAFHNRPSIKLVLPDHIKGFLVDDWENVTKNNQLVHLPHPKPVEVILQDYLAAEKPNRDEGSTQMDILEETIAGLREYFDRALGRILLYRLVSIWITTARQATNVVTNCYLSFERAQYADQQSKWSGENNKEGPSTTYGAEHLSRLLGKSLRTAHLTVEVCMQLTHI